MIMVIGIIGESCTGKTTIVNELKKHIDITVFQGKDYLKLDKNPKNAELKFVKLLNEADDRIIVYVITEKSHLAFLPSDSKKVLVQEELEVIKDRFSKRMNGFLPKPVEMMLEKKHGMFDHINYDLVIKSETLEEKVSKILEVI
ncbi:hypothetical protein ACAG96_07315 [Candidatus Izemoplasma sp. B36]|uniref:hypothetical protein n=1 Tax=Candidatus Izemoplasma sp. B36 TaxID=3242468 RepID=UPI003556050A